MRVDKFVQLYSARGSASRLLTGVLGITATSLSACSPDDVRLPRTAVHDSAGIEIVENLDPCWEVDSGWRLSDSPVTTIGVVEGDPAHELYRPKSALRLSDGKVVIMNAGTAELRFFDARGAFLSSAGGFGEGPGELGDIIAGALVTREDTVVVYESGRVSVFDAAGVYARSYSTLRHLGNTDPIIGMLPDRSIVLRIEGLGLGVRETGVWQDSAVYYRLTSDGVIADTLGTFFAADMFFRRGTNPMGGGQISSLPFGRTGHAAILTDGFVYGSSHRYEFRIHAPNGALRRIIRFTRETTSIPSQRLDSVRTARLENADTPAERAAAELMVREAAALETLPAFADLATDLDGNLWVMEYDQSRDQPSQWTVVAADGACRGSVHVPFGLSIHQIGHDYVIGEAADTMGVQRVEVYALTKGSG